MLTTREPAVLVLEDGRTFTGRAYGRRGTTVGEAVFSTGMTGYQETLTDPSYHGQVVVMTAPHVGNTGWNDEDDESGRIWVAGYVVRDPALRPSSWRSRRPLEDELEAQGVVGICDLDTRALTRHLRERGAMRVGIFSGDAASTPGDQLLARVADATRAVASPRGLGDLTTREREVLVEVAGGYSNEEIAARLYLSESTVKTHLVRVFAKLGVDGRAAAVAEATRRGVIELT